MHHHVRACLATMNWLLSSPEHVSYHHTLLCDVVVRVCCGLDNTWRGFYPQRVRLGAATCRLPPPKAGTTPHPLHQIHHIITHCIIHLIHQCMYCTTHQTIQHTYILYPLYVPYNTKQYNTKHIEMLSYRYHHTISILHWYSKTHHTTQYHIQHNTIYIICIYISIHMHVYVLFGMIYVCSCLSVVCMWYYLIMYVMHTHDVNSYVHCDTPINSILLLGWSDHTNTQIRGSRPTGCSFSSLCMSCLCIIYIHIHTHVQSCPAYVITCLICMHVCMSSHIHSYTQSISHRYPSIANYYYHTNSINRWGWYNTLVKYSTQHNTTTHHNTILIHRVHCDCEYACHVCMF